MGIRRPFCPVLLANRVGPPSRSVHMGCVQGIVIVNHFGYKFKSPARKCWLVLSLSIIAFLFVRFGFSESPQFGLLVIWVFVTVLSMGVPWIVQHHRFRDYLEKNHHEKWEELTYIRGVGSGCVNSIREWAFVSSEDDLGAPIIRLFKRDYNYMVFQWIILAVIFSALGILNFVL